MCFYSVGCSVLLLFSCGVGELSASAVWVVFGG